MMVWGPGTGEQGPTCGIEAAWTLQFPHGANLHFGHVERMARSGLHLVPGPRFPVPETEK